MKLTIERAALLKALAHAQSVVERRNTIPILSNVLLEAAPGGLALTATDMDLAIAEQTPADVSVPGATTVSVHTLYDIVRKLPDGAQVEIATGDSEGGDAGQLSLRGGRSRFRLPTLPRDDFPMLGDNAELPHGFSLPAAELKSLIDRTRFAISTEETRYYLNGIYLHATKPGNGKAQDGDSQLRAVATDGHRLARSETALPAGAQNMPGVIVPRKAVTELYKLVQDSTESVAVNLSDTKIRFALDSVVLTSKLIDGTFPDYERVIPAGNDKMMEVDSRDFEAAVDRCQTIAAEKSRAVKLSLKKNSLTVSASSPENGTASEELEVDYKGGAIEIGFNARYLLDIAQQVKSGRARFALADAASPTIIRDADDDAALYVLMPMRV
jgi:DNA polymerase-3 subunit beta